MSSLAAQFLIPSQGAAVRPGAGAPASDAPDGAFAALLGGSTAAPTPRPGLDRVGAVSLTARQQAGETGEDFAAGLRATRLETGIAPGDAARTHGAQGEGAMAGGLAGDGSAVIATQTAGESAPLRPDAVVTNFAADPPATANARAHRAVAADAPQAQRQGSVEALVSGAVEDSPVQSGLGAANAPRPATPSAGTGPEAGAVGEAVVNAASKAGPGLQMATRADPAAQTVPTGGTAPRGALRDGAGEDPAPAAPANKGAAASKAGPDSVHPGAGAQPEASPAAKASADPQASAATRTQDGGPPGAGASPALPGGDPAPAATGEIDSAPRPANPALPASAVETQGAPAAPASPAPTGPETQPTARPSQSAEPAQPAAPSLKADAPAGKAGEAIDRAAMTPGGQGAKPVSPGAAPSAETPQSAPAKPAGSQAAMDSGDTPAIVKASASDAALDPLVRAERAASDLAAARAPGALVRAASRAVNADAGAVKVEGADKAAASVPAEAASAKPAAPAPGQPALAGVPVLAMTASAVGWSAAQFAAVLQGAGETSAADEGDLSFDPALSRTDARADLQRHAAPPAASAQAAPRFQPQTVQTLAARIAARAVEGGRVFDIRLDPAELGRVEVRLELGSDNSVRALLSAERAETLAELQRSARDLERALTEAGLDLAEDGLSFSLSDDGAPSDEDRSGPDFGAAALRSAEAQAGDPGAGPSGPVRHYGFELAAKSGLDVRI